LKAKSSTVLSIQEVLQATNGRLRGGQTEGVFRGVSTDSRQISKGNLFICLEGENFDGITLSMLPLPAGQPAWLSGRMPKLISGRFHGKSRLFR